MLKFHPNIRNKICYLLITTTFFCKKPIQNIWGIERRKKYQIGPELINLSLFAGDMIFFIENSKEYTIKSTRDNEFRL